MTKAQNSKPLIRVKTEKSKVTTNSLRMANKKTGIVNVKGINPKKPKLFESSVRDSKRIPKNGKAVETIKDVETAVSVPVKRLVLAPPKSPTPIEHPKVRKKLAKSNENCASNGSKDEPNEKIIKDQLAPLNKSNNESKQFGKKEKNYGRQLKTKEAELKPKKSETKKSKMHKAVPVDEEEFDAIVTQENVAKVVNALKTLTQKEVAAKKTSIFGDFNYCLNVSCFKIANCPKRLYKLYLKHPMFDPNSDDVLIIVPDLKRGAKVEFDSTIEHYTDLFREAGIKGLKIMPFNQLRNEYKTFESKRKLASTYDYYLCDGRIAGQIVGFCGKTFQKPRTTFHTVRMENKNAIKQEIEKALRRTAYKHLGKGDLISIPVGSDKLSPEQIAENIIQVILQLKTKYPGGLENVRGIDIKVNITGTSSLPIYASTASGPTEVPNVIGPREQRMLQMKKQTNEILSKFTLTKEAELLKLNKTQVERKRKFIQMRNDLITYQTKTPKGTEEEASHKEEAADEEVPTKKTRKGVADKKLKSKITSKNES